MVSISIIMPCYEAQETIIQSIESIIRQTYTDWELLIIDDFSQDNTVKKIKKYVNLDKRISLFESTKNFGGPSRPRNIGLERASSEFIAFCDSDDVWHERKLEFQMKTLSEQNADLVATKSKSFVAIKDLNFNEVDKKFETLNKKRILFRNGILNSSVLVKKNIFDTLGRFTEREDLIAVEDYDMWLRISRNNKKLVLLTSQLTGYRISKNSLSNNKLGRILKFYKIYKKYHNENESKFSSILSFFNLIIFISFWLAKKTK